MQYRPNVADQNKRYAARAIFRRLCFDGQQEVRDNRSPWTTLPPQSLAEGIRIVNQIEAEIRTWRN